MSAVPVPGPITTTGDVDRYLLPDHRQEAAARFATHWFDPGSPCIVMDFQAGSPEMHANLLEAQRRGLNPKAFYCLRQAHGPALDQMKAQVAAGVEVTLGMSILDDSDIAHEKRHLCNPVVMLGSVNFSGDKAWKQVNDFEVFEDAGFADILVAQFEEMVIHAWQALREHQLMPAPPAWIAAGKGCRG
jgi:hypothetical protein